MWAHQYLQAINEINAIKADPHVWTHDGDMAGTYGLEPNYGCCTANFNQGWPKFTNMVVMSSKSQKAPVVALIAPVSATLSNGVTVDIDTNYPFEDTATITCTSASPATPLLIRVPGWAGEGATLNGKRVSPGTMVAQKCAEKGGKGTFVLKLAPEIRLEKWGDQKGDKAPVSVLRGALLYSLPIGAKYTT